MSPNPSLNNQFDIKVTLVNDHSWIRLQYNDR